ncbi:MAG: hypothetical protein WCQ54_04635 [Clostridiaceae bacterium]
MSLFSAAGYTQLTAVETEISGLLRDCKDSVSCCKAAAAFN